jgi:ankyrin repeat protein
MVDPVLGAWRAARVDDLEVLSHLVPGQVPANSKIISETDQCHSLLMIAAARGAVACIDYLLENDADPNLKNFHGFSALHWASFTGQVASVTQLLEKGADINIRTVDGKTPFHVAAFRGHSTVVQLLADRGADIYACNWDGLSALHFAIIAGQKAVAALLINIGVPTDENTASNQRLEDFAAAKRVTWLQELLKR